MVAKQPTRNHLTFSELLERWKCTEKELRTAIIRSDIKPSIKLHERQPLLSWALDINGTVTAFESDSYRNPKPQQWLYLQDPIKTGDFDCEFTLATDDRDPVKHEVPLSDWLRLPVPMSIDDVKSKAVFLLTEVEMYEQNHLPKSSGNSSDTPLGARERNTLLKIIFGMARRGYGYAPEALKSEIPKAISEDLSTLDLDVTAETVRKYLKEAKELFWEKKQDKES